MDKHGDCLIDGYRWRLFDWLDIDGNW